MLIDADCVARWLASKKDKGRKATRKELFYRFGDALYVSIWAKFTEFLVDGPEVSDRNMDSDKHVLIPTRFFPNLISGIITQKR